MQQSIPDGHVRVSVKFGAQWFATDFSVHSAGGEMDRLAAELRADGDLDWVPGFARTATSVIGLMRSAAADKDVRTVCLSALWIVFHRPPDAQAAQEFFLEIIEFEGRAWIGVSVDESGGLASFSYDIAPAHLAEADTDLEALEILPVRCPSH
jgi:hypothetical protein